MILMKLCTGNITNYMDANYGNIILFILAQMYASVFDCYMQSILQNRLNDAGTNNVLFIDKTR